MRATISAIVKTKWARLTSYSGSKRLSWFALILLFAIDYYVLTLVFDGMYNAARGIDYPRARVSADCKSVATVFLTGTPAKRVEVMGDYVKQIKERAPENFAREFYDYYVDLLPICTTVRDHLFAAASDAHLRELYAKRDKRDAQEKEIKEKIQDLNASYRDALLEKIADQKRSESILPADARQIKAEIARLEGDVAALRQQQIEINTNLSSATAIQTFSTFLRTSPIMDEFGREEARYQHLTFWYPIKVLLAQGGFLLPLLLFTVYWNGREIRKQRYIQILISSHLILVCAFPLFAKLLDFVYQLLPQALWELVLSRLVEWRVAFLWNYFVIALGVGGGILLIAIAQRTVFTQARLRASRLRKNLCRECGSKLQASGQAWCEVCGSNQIADCGHCGKPQRLLAFHCSHCGTSMPARSER